MRDGSMSPPLPLVSIGLPVYNGELRVKRALQSLVEQTYSNIELIVCDDSSTDRTPEICEKFAERYPLIRFIRNEVNLGAHHNFRKTLGLAVGEYFMWADQDDYWDPEFVSTLVVELDRDPRVISAMSAGKVVWPDGRESEIVRLVGSNKPQEHGHLVNAISVVAKRYQDSRRLKNNIFIHGLVRRNAFAAAVNAYPGVFQHERQIVCHLALAGRLVFIDKMLFERTRHQRQLKERRPPTDATVVAKSRPLPKIRYMWGLSVSILRSSIIAWHRKLYLPVILFSYFWTAVVMKHFLKAVGATLQILPTPLYEGLKRQWTQLRSYLFSHTPSDR